MGTTAFMFETVYFVDDIGLAKWHGILPIVNGVLFISAVF